MKHRRGFTLIELVVTLGIAAILLTVAVPGFRDVIMDNRLVSQANQFLISNKLARSSAIRFQRNAIICVSTSYDAAIPACTAGTDWSNGWIVWVDKDRDAATDANEIVSVFAPLSGSSTFTSLAVSGFTYDARGFVNAGDTLTLCDGRSAETGRTIRVNAVGRTNISRSGCD